MSTVIIGVGKWIRNVDINKTTTKFHVTKVKLTGLQLIPSADLHIYVPYCILKYSMLSVETRCKTQALEMKCLHTVKDMKSIQFMTMKTDCKQKM